MGKRAGSAGSGRHCVVFVTGHNDAVSVLFIVPFAVSFEGLITGTSVCVVGLVVGKIEDCEVFVLARISEIWDGNVGDDAVDFTLVKLRCGVKAFIGETI